MTEVMSNAKTATYLYCLLKSAKKPAVPAKLAGVPHAEKPRVLRSEAAAGLWLVVSTAPLSHYDEAPIKKHLEDLDSIAEYALSHERVVEAFAKSDALLPMKLFTLFRDDARALAHVEREKKRIGSALDRVEGHAEWGVRVSYDADAVKKAAERDALAAGPASSGKSFLMKKKLLKDAAQEVHDRARVRAEEIYEELGRAAEDALKRPLGTDPPGSRVLIDAAFLVSRKKEKSFEKLVKKKEAEVEALGYRVALTGPWPAYHFVSEAA